VRYGLGIDLGGSSVKAVAVTPEGQTLQRTQADFDPAVRMDWATEVRSLVARLQREHGTELSFLGLSAPGLAARDGRSIAHMPGRLAGLEGLDWQNYLEVPCPVPVLNDAHAALLGEVWLGAAQGCENVILLTLGTGVGGAAMVDGRLLRGEIGRAGHLGHICLDPDGPPDVCRLPGSLEVQIGNCTILERTAGRFRSTHDLVAAHRSGDAEATRIWLKSVRALACGIASLINVLDPAAVIIGGGIARAGAALFEPLQQFLGEVEWQIGSHRIRILPAALGEFAGACGAARHAGLA
jgi:glucokinase